MKYEANETMAMIGQQTIYSTMFERYEIMKEFRDVVNGNIEDNKLFSLIDPVEFTDFFMLGYIWGKRDERKKKNMTAKQELVDFIKSLNAEQAKKLVEHLDYIKVRASLTDKDIETGAIYESH